MWCLVVDEVDMVKFVVGDFFGGWCYVFLW